MLIIFELTNKVAHIFIAGAERYFGNWCIAFQKKSRSLVNTVFVEISKGGFAYLLFEKFAEVIFIHVCTFR